MYRRHQYHTLSAEERSRGGEVQCVAQQPNAQEPAYRAIDLSTVDPRALRTDSEERVYFKGVQSCSRRATSLQSLVLAHLPGGF